MAEPTISADAAADWLGIRNGPLAVIAAVATLLVLHEGAPVFGPVFVSVLLAYALEPLVSALVRLRLPRIVAALVAYAVLAASAIFVGQTARTPVGNFLRDLPPRLASMRASIQKKDASGRSGPMNRIQDAVKDLQATSIAKPPPADGDVRRVVPVPRSFTARNYLMDASVGLLGISIRGIAIALLTFLLVTAGDLLKRKAIAIAGPRFAERRLTLEVIKSIDRQIERYLAVRLLISAIVAALTWMALWFVGLHHSGVWGLIAGALNVVPFVGPTVACAAITVAAALQFHAIQPTVIAAVATIAIAALEGNLISPWLTSRAGELNTVAVFVSVLFWGWTWGLWGLVLAVPMTVALKAAADHIEGLSPLGELLGR